MNLYTKKEKALSSSDLNFFNASYNHDFLAI